MTLTVNGEPTEVAHGCTVAGLVTDVAPAGVAAHTAVARNGEVVPRSAWERTVLIDGDRIELLTAAQGG
jgi:sulfur carrier protein